MDSITLTAERLRELLHYDSNSGVFTYRNSRGPRAAGSAAGSLSADGYIVIRVDFELCKAGRLAWLYTHGEWPRGKVWYIDRCRTNNRIDNLAEGHIKRVRKPRQELTAELLRSLVRYSPETGEFFRVKNGTPFIGDVGKHVRLTVNGKRYQAHRLAWLYMTGAWPTAFIDHKDRNGTNNAWTNLREATNSQNQQNSKKRAGTSSCTTGVSWDRRAKRWHVSLMHSGTRIFLGRFETLDTAVQARLDGERKYFTHSPVCEPLA